MLGGYLHSVLMLGNFFAPV